MIEKSICDILKTPLQSTGKTSESTLRRRANIDWIKDLPRKGLCFGKAEDQILMASTDFDEDIYIQFPGKESITSRAKPRPWDFRPKIFLRKKNKYYEGINSFVEIWGQLFDILEPIKDKEEESIRALATLFYRMAFMMDHASVALEDDLTFRRLQIDEKEKVIDKNTKKMKPWHRYAPSKKAIAAISKGIPRIGEISMEAFLYYNELLGWNEDCKYFHRNLTEKEGLWIGPTGRVNTLLTHSAIMGFVLRDIKLEDILGRFTRQRGVSPPTKQEIIKMCNGFIETRINT